MRILWITNSLLPDIAAKLENKRNVSGHWMQMLKEYLISDERCTLAIASVSNSVSLLHKDIIDGVIYYVIPKGRGNLYYNKDYEQYWRMIEDDFKPLIVHIHGTEFSHGLSWLCSCSVNNVVVSVQGLISIIARYYLAGMQTSEIIKSFRLLDYLRSADLLSQNRIFHRRGKIEAEYFKKIKYVIGRTEWDKVHVKALNPFVNYFHCDEILGNLYYKNKWEYEKCKPHSVFISQATYSIKGFHILVKALPYVLAEFPDTKVYVAGSDLFRISGLKKIYRGTGYVRYITALIKRLNLGDNIIFIGPQSSDEMIMQYLTSNVFVVPSSVENSSNSLSEAQILGVPCVASYVGGNGQFMQNGTAGLLYRFEEYEMLADNIKRIFRGDYGYDLSYARNIALRRHDSTKIVNDLLCIYKVIKDESNHKEN